MTSIPHVAGRVGAIAGLAVGASFLSMVARSAIDSPTNVPGLDGRHPDGPAGAPATSREAHLGRVPSGILTWMQTAASQTVRGVEHLFGYSPSAHDAKVYADADTPKRQAEGTWAALHETMAISGIPGLYQHRSGGPPHVTAVWGAGQGIAAALDLAQLTGDWSAANHMFDQLPLYAQKGGYAPGPGPGTNVSRFWDDNAWIGLDLMQAYAATKDHTYLDRAVDMLPFIKAGQQANGGMLWEEGNERPSFNTCTNGPTLELLLRIHQATGRADVLEMATRIDGYMEGSLRRKDGLYVDNVGQADGTVGGDLYSYNQGTPIGADVLWFRQTGDTRRLAHAKQTADAALAWLGTGDTLWHQAPVFNAIFFRNLLALDAVAPDPRYRAALQAYVDRGWKEARDPQTGLFTRGGVGSYEHNQPGSQIDQAAWVQMQSLLAMKTGPDRPDVA